MTSVDTQINGRTADEWETLAQSYERQAADSRARSAESWERSDTDGFLSQWAADSMARQHDAGAEWARNHGYVEVEILLDLTGAIACEREGEGQYGCYWVLNDEHAARLGKRFYSQSRARSYRRQRATNEAKGFRVGRARIPALPPRLSGTNAVALSVWTQPQWERVGEAVVIDADFLATLAERDGE